MVVITVILFTTNVQLALITVLLVVPALVLHVAVVPAWPPSAATTGCATASPTCWPTCPRACTACASSPPTTASATTSSTTATWWASTATPTTTPPTINAIYGPGTQLLGVLGQAALLAIGGDMVCTTRSSIGAPGRLLLVPEPLLRAHPAAGPAVQQLPAGPGLGHQAAHPARHRAHRHRGARRRGAAAHRGGDRLRPRDLRLRPRPAR